MIHATADGDEPARWQFFAGDETEAFVDDPENIRVFSLNTIANHDPSVVPYLTAPVGSVWVRDGQRFVREGDLGAPRTHNVLAPTGATAPVAPFVFEPRNAARRPIGLASSGLHFGGRRVMLSQ
jgi:hypothetical protein